MSRAVQHLDRILTNNWRVVILGGVKRKINLFATAPIAVVLLVRLLIVFLRSGWGGFTIVTALQNLWILLGFGVGWWMWNLESNPWVKTNWPITKYAPFRNVLVVTLIGILGLWVTSSSPSVLASGLVWGMGVRAFWEMVRATDLTSWFAVFARSFSEKEQRSFVFGLAIVLLIQGWLLTGY